MELWQAVQELVIALASALMHVVVNWGLLIVAVIAWIAWWLFGVSWKKVWPMLAEGSWVPGVLVLIVTALVWSQIAPGDCNCLGFTTLPSFWWQLGAVALLAGTALFCGWLQGYFGWTPEEVSFEPASVAAEHGHHNHGHHDHGHHDHGHHDHGHHDHGHHH